MLKDYYIMYILQMFNKHENTRELKTLPYKERRKRKGLQREREKGERKDAQIEKEMQLE